MILPSDWAVAAQHLPIAISFVSFLSGVKQRMSATQDTIALNDFAGCSPSADYLTEIPQPSVDVHNQCIGSAMLRALSP